MRFIVNTFLLSVLILVYSASSIAETKLQFCSTAKAVESKDGIRRLALIIGVGQYKSEKVPDLQGPPNDAKHFYELLTNPKGYDFPKENVCMLLEEEATTTNFTHYFTEALVKRARANDEVVFYYAGHGSQTADVNHDEPDGLDETFVFHDARSGNINDFVDDDFDALLKWLHAKTQHISLFLDSCNSGTALRGSDSFVSRFLPPASKRLTAALQSDNNNSIGWVSSSLPGIVVFTAASDGTSALERDGRGVFTDALLTALGQANTAQLTYAQVARQIRPLVKAESYQIPYFQGDLERGVFANASRQQPLGWEIIETSPKLKLSGFPLPGIGKNAELRVYSGSASGAETQDPSKAKAVIVLGDSDGIIATAQVIAKSKNAEAIKLGDLAVLARSGDQQTVLKVTLKSQKEICGAPSKKRKCTVSPALSPDQVQKLTKALAGHSDAKKVVFFVPNAGDFEVSLNDKGDYQIKGPEDSIRNTMESENAVIHNLWLHAKQKALAALRGEGGSEFKDQETLQVQLIPAQQQDACAKGSKWQQQTMNSMQPQDMPVCMKWNVKVKLSEKAQKPMLIGGLVLSTDGNIWAFPNDGTAAPVNPGKEYVFAAKGETFKATPPLNVQDQIIVFGTHEANPVAWGRLADTSETRGADMESRGIKSGLYRTLDKYLSGTRGAGKADDSEPEVDTTWTLSTVTMRVNGPKH